MPDIDRKMIANYFKPSSDWPLGLILVSVVLVIIMMAAKGNIPRFRDIVTPMVSVAFALGSIGFIGLITANKKASDSQMDKWWKQELQGLQKRGLFKVGLDTSDCIADCEPVWGPRIENTGGVPLQLEKGRDRVIRYNPVDLSIIFLAENQLVSYQVCYDRFTGNALQEETDEYFYQDVVSVSTKTKTTSKVLKVGMRAERIQMKSAELFQLTTSGGTSITVFLRADALEKIKRARGGALPTDQAEKVVLAVRRMLRDKKANT